MRVRLASISTVTCLLAAPSGALGQDALPPGGDAPAFQLDLTKPFFEGSSDAFATSTLDATAVVPVRGELSLFGRVAFAYARLESSTGTMLTSSALSNLRVGAVLGGPRATYGEAHVDLPFAHDFGDGDFAAEVAAVADYEHQERFYADSWSIGASVAHEREVGPGRSFGGRIGGTLWIPTGEGSGFQRDNEAWALYGAFASVLAGPTKVGATVSGLWLLTEASLDFGEATTAYLTPSISLPEARFAPELYGRIPLDDDLQNLNLVLGVRARFGG